MMAVLIMIASAIVVTKGVCVLNVMSRGSHPGLRFAWTTLTVAAAAHLLSTADPGVVAADWTRMLFDWAVVAIVMFERRSNENHD